MIVKVKRRAVPVNAKGREVPVKDEGSDEGNPEQKFGASSGREREGSDKDDGG